MNKDKFISTPNLSIEEIIKLNKVVDERRNVDLVKKWLADPESVSQKELEDNYNNAKAAWDAADTADFWAAAWDAADWATYWAVEGNVELAKHWVERYEELVK